MQIVSSQFEINGLSKTMIFRIDSAGDKGALLQIFINKDYDISQWPQGQRLVDYYAEKSQSAPALIVDAGANIGASVVAFSAYFPKSCIFSIEPDDANWSILSFNTREINCLISKGLFRILMAS